MTKPTYRPALFTADWLPEGKSIPGFSCGAAWNGWACPEFEIAQAQEAAALMTDDEAPRLTYDAARDVWLEASPDYPGEPPYEYPATTITLADGTTRKTYGIGAFAWCWDEADSEEHLRIVLQAWCKAQGLECRSADDMLADSGLTEPQRAWLSVFVQVWDRVMAAD